MKPIVVKQQFWKIFTTSECTYHHRCFLRFNCLLNMTNIIFQCFDFLFGLKMKNVNGWTSIEIEIYKLWKNSATLITIRKCLGTCYKLLFRYSTFQKIYNQSYTLKDLHFFVAIPTRSWFVLFREFFSGNWIQWLDVEPRDRLPFSEWWQKLLPSAVGMPAFLPQPATCCSWRTGPRSRESRYPSRFGWGLDGSKCWGNCCSVSGIHRRYQMRCFCPLGRGTVVDELLAVNWDRTMLDKGQTQTDGRTLVKVLENHGIVQSAVMRDTPFFIWYDTASIFVLSISVPIFLTYRFITTSENKKSDFLIYRQ